MQILLGGGLGSVPTADTTDNATCADVLGNKSDVADSSSAYAKLSCVHQCFANMGGIYPAASGNGYVTITSGANWAMGSYTEIIAASSISKDFILTDIVFSGNMGSTEREIMIELAYGGSDTHLTYVKFASTSTYVDNMEYPVLSGIIPADSRIRGRATYSGTGTINLYVIVKYIELD